MCEAPGYISALQKKEETLSTDILSWFLLFQGSKSGNILGSWSGLMGMFFPVVVRWRCDARDESWTSCNAWYVFSLLISPVHEFFLNTVFMVNL